MISQDRCERAWALKARRSVASPIPVTYFFSTPQHDLTSAIVALRSTGITEIVADEELTGDAFWHVAAFSTLLLTDSATQAAHRAMEELAAQTGVQYDGWCVTRAAGEDDLSAQH